MSLKTLVKCLLQELKGARAVRSALRSYRQGNGIAHHDWEQMLWAHCATNGGFTDRLTGLLHRINPPLAPAPIDGLLGHFTIADQKRIADQIARDGYYIFDRLMPEHVCAEIEKFARRTPAYMEDEFGIAEQPELYNPHRPRARMYKFRERDLLTNTAVQGLMADQSFLRIAETYLETRAVIGGINSWWSAPYGNGPSSQAAQLFHFDFDAPPRWLKLFIYVTPVGAENGPHVFVRGSHRGKLPESQELVSRGYARIPDGDIAAAFGEKAPVEISGPRGTVFLADTRGFHKGKHPTGGDRLICQIIYCSAVFNNHSPRPVHNVNFAPELTIAIGGNADAYKRYL